MSASAPPKDFDELVDLWRTLFPESYTVPLEDPPEGEGFDLTAQQARIFARASEAADATTQRYYLRAHSSQTGPPAAGAARATGNVEITRAAPAANTITLGAGTELVSRLRDSLGETVDWIRVRLIADVTFAAGALGPLTAAVEAVRVGPQGDVDAGTIDRFAARGTSTVIGSVTAANLMADGGSEDIFTPAMIGQYVSFTAGANLGADPRRILGVTAGVPNVAELDGAALILGAATVDVLEFSGLGLTVAQAAALDGGRHGWLDAIGAERRVFRQVGESDDLYRERIGELADIISPAAIIRIAYRILSPLGVRFSLMETRGPLLPGVVLDLDPCDRGTITTGEVLVGGAFEFRGFVLRVGAGGQGEFGAPCDTPFAGSLPGGNAADLLALDGYPVDYFAALAALWSDIEAARAAGVAWLLVRDPTLI
jgi:hypothetical protein